MHNIFLHGLGQTPTSWDQVLSFLEEEQIDCPNLFSFVKERAATYDNIIKPLNDIATASLSRLVYVVYRLVQF